MSREIVIDPVTRIEGHSKITIHLDDAGNVQDALFHVTQLRGFEKFAEGRPVPRDALADGAHLRHLSGQPPGRLGQGLRHADVGAHSPTAVKLRTILNLAQIAQSHALSFFYLSSPDLLLGMDADPAVRNIVGVVADQSRAGA